MPKRIYYSRKPLSADGMMVIPRKLMKLRYAQQCINGVYLVNMGKSVKLGLISTYHNTHLIIRALSKKSLNRFIPNYGCPYSYKMNMKFLLIGAGRVTPA